MYSLQLGRMGSRSYEGVEWQVVGLQLLLVDERGLEVVVVKVEEEKVETDPSEIPPLLELFCSLSFLCSDDPD